MINLMVSGNNNVKDGLLIIVLSYLRYNEEPVNIYFLTMDLHEYNPRFVPLEDEYIEKIREILKKKNPKSDIFKVDLTEEVKKDILMKKFRKSSYSPYALLRLYTDKIDSLPEKVLYLDTDIMILGNIKPLFDLDITGYEFAGGLDYLGRNWLGIDYQNSGVLLINVKESKSTNLFEKCRFFLVNHHPILADQDALNFTVRRKKFFPMRYNEQYKKQEDTVIRHFTKTIRFLPFFHTLNVKPWQVDRVHKVLKTHEYDIILDEFLEVKKEINNG